jgi:hypothetical protein
MTKNLAPLELGYGETTLTCPIENGHRMVPVRTVCQIIDVDFVNQNNWLKKHPIYAQLYNPSTTTGADGKSYTMNCLSFFDLFGWLNSIGEKDRKEGSYERQLAFMAWLREQHMAIYKAVDVLRQEHEYEGQLLDEKLQTINDIEYAADTLKGLKKRLKTITETLETVRHNRLTGQMQISFPAEE